MSWRIVLALFVGSLCLPIAGCGDDEPQAPARRRSKKKKRPKAAVAGADAPLDMSRVPEKLRNVDWKAEVGDRKRETRDPFLPFVDDLVVEVPTEANGPKTDANLRPIDLFDVDELELIAIITGTALHKAMVKDPTGLGHIVREGDVIGRGTPMRVQRITRNEVLFKPLKAPSDQENQPKELRKVLLTQEELEELLP